MIKLAVNFYATRKPYGTRGAQDRQIIALSEGWAYYRQWRLEIDILSFPSILVEFNSPFPINYGFMFRELIDEGISNVDIEFALSSNNIIEFRNRLIQRRSNLTNRITQIIS
jgi:hypothetical protein